MRIAVIHNQPSPADLHFTGSPHRGAAAELGVVDQAKLIASILAEAGHDCTGFAAGGTADLCRFLTSVRPDLIFNCCEGLRGNAALEMNVAALFELFDVNFTGSGALTLGLALDKARTKAVLRGRGIATPDYVALALGEDPSAANALSFPVIVKPAEEDASIGIDDDAVVHDRDKLQARIRFVWAEFRQTALIEEFIDGREFNVGLIADPAGGWITLPIGEFCFDRLPAGRPRIIGYQAKWNPEADFTQAMASRVPARINVGLAQRLSAIAVEAAAALGLRDYGRVDLRVRSGDMATFVLEVNPNPDLNEECEFLRAARASGRSNSETIREIVARASDRTPRAAGRGL